MVDMAHNDNDRCARNEVFLAVGGFVEKLILERDNDFAFHLYAEFIGDKVCGVVIYGFVYGYHRAHRHELFDNFRRRRFHAGGKLRYRDGFGNGYFELNGLGLLCGLLRLLHALFVKLLFALLLVIREFVFLFDLLHACLGFGRGVVFQYLFVILGKIDTGVAACIHDPDFIARALLLWLRFYARGFSLFALFLLGGCASGFQLLALLLLAGVLFVLIGFQISGKIHLVVLCDGFEEQIELVLLEHRHVRFPGIPCVFEYVQEILAFHIEILGKGIYSDFFTRCCHIVTPLSV